MLELFFRISKVVPPKKPNIFGCWHNLKILDLKIKQILSGFFFEFEKVQNRMKKGIDAVYKKRERQGSNLRMQSTLA